MRNKIIIKYGDDMKKISIWKENAIIKKYSKLNENKKVDVLIIGGGITGASIYYHLKNSKLNIMLVEQNKIGFGTTGNSTGKLSYLQNDLLDKIRKNYKDKKASMYLESQKRAIELIKNIIKNEKIECDFERVNSIIFTNKKEDINKIKSLERFLEENNTKVYKGHLSILKNIYSIYVKDTYMFNPLKFTQSLLDEGNIYENTSIKKIKKQDNYYRCYTDKNEIIAKSVVIASHYPFFNFPFIFPLKSSLEKSYMSSSKYQTNPISLISYSAPFTSLRTYKDNVIYLNGSHTLNKNICNIKKFKKLIKKNELKLKPNYIWSNIDIITNDGLPYIGKIKDNLLIATGYNTWGLTNGVLAGKIISDIILNRDGSYIKLFNPLRMNKYICLGMLKNIYNSASGYLKGLLKGKKKCPHMGCKLIYNKAESTWDCPCHGSRFDKDGKCISAPANRKI